MQREALLAKFEELPQDLETLIDEINGLSAEADAIVCSNPQVLEQYKTRLAKIEVLLLLLLLLLYNLTERGHFEALFNPFFSCFPRGLLPLLDCRTSR